MATKAWMVAALASVMVLLAATAALPACFGFSDDEMPAVVAEYVCKYSAVGGRVIGVQEATNGPIWHVQLIGPDGEPIGLVQHDEAADGSLGRIIYFQLPNGTVLLDRRANS